jgi:uncharacterized integral membrane protein
MDRNDPGTNRGSRWSPRLFVVLLLAVLLVIFTLQNQEKVSLRLFFWTISDIPVVLLIMVSLLLGYLIPWLAFVAGIGRTRRRGSSGRKEEITGRRPVSADEGEVSADEGEDSGEEGDASDEEEDESDEEEERGRPGSGWSTPRTAPPVRSAAPKPDPEGIAFDDDPVRDEPALTRKFFRE